MKLKYAVALLIALFLLGFGIIVSQAGTAGNDTHSSTDIIRTNPTNENSGFGGIK